MVLVETTSVEMSIVREIDDKNSVKYKAFLNRSQVASGDNVNKCMKKLTDIVTAVF